MLCVAEKPPIQALEWTAPTLPVRPGHLEAASFDYIRHGTTTLFAALEVATGRVPETYTQRRRHRPQKFSAFFKQVAAGYPRRAFARGGRQLRHPQTPTVRAWLKRHPRVRLRFPRPRAPGSTWSRRSSRPSPTRPCAVVASRPSPT
jgi:hypothetical protein